MGTEVGIKITPCSQGFSARESRKALGMRLVGNRCNMSAGWGSSFEQLGPGLEALTPVAQG